MPGIVYRARLADAAALPALVDLARSHAEVRGWAASEAPETRLAGVTIRSLDGATSGRASLELAGAWVNPHLASDDVCLVFDRTTGELVDASRGAGAPGARVVNGFALVRTTWTDARTHLGIIALFEALAEADLASVEMGDPRGATFAREAADVEARIHEARREALRAALGRPEEPFRPWGPVELLPVAEARRRSAAPPGPLDRLPEAERSALRRARERLLARWGATATGLDGPPETALPALENVTDLVLSHPDHRHDPETLLEEFAWDAGAMLGFLLVESLGGHWERVDGSAGPVLRVANLGGAGLTWRPMWSATQRLREGPLYAHDTVATWLGEIASDAREALADA